jgi:thymidylate kinase
MLVTVSGPVGSGKSTIVEQILDFARTQGRHASYWRFQTLPCFRLLRRREPVETDPEPGSPAPRGAGYGRRPLGVRAATLLIVRMLAFGVYRRLHRRDQWFVCNRYFYDNLVHFEMTTHRSRMYASLLRWCVPRPDVAFLVGAPVPVIASRRPGYAEEYLTSTTEAYGRLRGDFPQLIDVSGQDLAAARAVIEAACAKIVPGSLRTAEKETA